MSEQTIREQVRARYAAAAAAVSHGGRTAAQVMGGDGRGTGDCCTGGPGESAVGFGAGRGATDTGGSGEPAAGFGAGRYAAGERDALPAGALAASLGCGNPTAVADLRPGERVLDLGSGGGIDVLLSARRVGPTGFAYGVDMTDEMLELAEANRAEAGATNVEFRKGTVEDIPLPDAGVDVVISNCVINLSPDKPAVLAEMHRVLVPGGRIGISDIVAEDHLTPADRAARGSHVGCIAGALSRREYLAGLAAAGFTDATVTFTHEAAPGMHAAIIRATRDGAAGAPPSHAGTVDRASGPAATSCCDSSTQRTCCGPADKDACCGSQAGPTPGGCGCR